MLTKQEWVEQILGLARVDVLELTQKQLDQIDADWRRFEERMRDPEAWEKAKVAAQDACVRAHAEELAATYGAPGSVDAIERWLNARSDEDGELIIEGDMSKVKDDDGSD